VRVGLTGGIASGKSTVSAILRELGAVVIESDQLAREVVAGGTSGLDQVVEAFGPRVLTASGELDRPKLAAIVFGDEEARRRLESIVHPLVRAAAAEVAARTPSGVLLVHDVPLLVETGMAGTFDVVIVVDLPVDEAVRRMVRDRGWTEEEARARIAAQASRDERRALATYVIDNSGTREELRDQVERIYTELTRQSGSDAKDAPSI
jgi:dephospho-CoA kinase